MKTVPGNPARLARRLSGTLVVLFTLSWTGLALAGGYMDRAGLLVRQARQEGDYLEHRRGSKELAELVHQLAAARLLAARDGFVPKEVIQAHPHLLLMLENCERAADAAESGRSERFAVFRQRAKDEEQVFRSIMRQLGFPLEDERKK